MGKNEILESDQASIKNRVSGRLHKFVSLDVIKAWTEGFKTLPPKEDEPRYVYHRSYEISCNKCFMSVDIPPFLWGVDVVTIKCSNCGNKWDQRRD